MDQRYFTIYILPIQGKRALHIFRASKPSLCTCEVQWVGGQGVGLGLGGMGFESLAYCCLTSCCRQEGPYLCAKYIVLNEGIYFLKFNAKIYHTPKIIMSESEFSLQSDKANNKMDLCQRGHNP